MKYIKTLNERYLSKLEDELRRDFGAEAEIYDHGDYLQLDKIVVDPSDRGKGLGTYAMDRICDYADSVGKDIRLTPSKSYGGSSVERLSRFYRRFGFEKNNDYKYKDTMVRYSN
tara:strand:- start:3302 stop:3643 length:342 start_codon:yes stop_codon:yes gene_type:complete